jgi:hypothetical protein
MKDSFLENILRLKQTVFSFKELLNKKKVWAVRVFKIASMSSKVYSPTPVRGMVERLRISMPMFMVFV